MYSVVSSNLLLLSMHTDGPKQWLDDHPSEAVFLSFQYEGSTTPYGSDNAVVDLMLFRVLNSTAAHSYLVQAQGEFGTLEMARGKITLLKRFDLSGLQASFAAALPGVHFSPSSWTNNSPNITLVFNKTAPAGTGTAYIEDYYSIGAPFGSSAGLAIEDKYSVTTAHMSLAASDQHSDSLFWTFASSEYDTNSPADTPIIMALGNGTASTPLGGVNQRLLPFIRAFPTGTRLGIVMFDFYAEPAGLVGALLDLQQPAMPG